MAAHTEHNVIINAPVDFVWNMANDLAYWPTLFQGHYASAELLEEAPGRLRFRLTTCADEQGRTHSWVSERYLDATRRCVLGRRVDPGPFLYMHIFQSFDPVPDGTAVRWVHDFEMLPGGRPADEEMAAYISRNAEANLGRHKSVIESLARSGTAETAVAVSLRPPTAQG